jgi:hypothetical protein
MIFDKYLAEFRGSLRLRLLLAGVVAILWLFAVINLRDLAIAKYTQFVGVERQIAKTKLQASQADWPQRLQAIKLLQVELEGRLWQNSTQGLAQAAFQDWLNQAAIRANLGRPAVTMLAVEDKADSGPSDNAPGTGSPDANLWRVRAKIEFDFTQPGLMNLLKQVTMNPQQVVVESLNIRKEPVPRADMLLVANFQKTAKK